MSAIKSVFAGESKVLNVYCTAGFPQLDSTKAVIESLAESGADLIEVGMPYSDPLADGPVIQDSSTVALRNGMTMKLLFRQLSEVTVNAPLILMGYMNPVLQYGFEAFCRDAAAAGVSGLILPDLPEHEFVTDYGPVIKKHGLDFIFLVTPETTDERIRRLDALSTGFIYAVSSSSTTGGARDLAGMQSYFDRLRGMGLKNKVLIGFGISNREAFEQACQYADGAIIGTAYIRELAKGGDVRETTRAFVKKIKGAN